MHVLLVLKSFFTKQEQCRFRLDGSYRLLTSMSPVLTYIAQPDATVALNNIYTTTYFRVNKSMYSSVITFLSMQGRNTFPRTIQRINDIFSLAFTGVMCECEIRISHKFSLSTQFKGESIVLIVRAGSFILMPLNEHIKQLYSITVIDAWRLNIYIIYPYRLQQ